MIFNVKKKKKISLPFTRIEEKRSALECTFSFKIWKKQAFNWE